MTVLGAFQAESAETEPQRLTYDVCRVVVVLDNWLAPARGKQLLNNELLRRPVACLPQMTQIHNG